jgi:hypothetical protein
MARTTFLTDDFLRYLMAVGQADVLVGLPTFNNATTVAEVVKAIHVSFGRDFPRHRTVLVNLDTGSTDGTPEIVRDASPVQLDTFTGASSLRTIHRISSPYHGLPGKANTLRTLFAAADLTQASTVAVIDPDVTSITPDWVKHLVDPVLREGYDFVAPVYARSPFDGPLVTQLLRPFFRATYRRPLLEPVGGEFAVSRAFAVQAGASPVWEETFPQWGIDIWLPCEAFATGRRVGQVCLGPRTVTAGPSRPALADVMRQVVGSLFTCLSLHEERWTKFEMTEEVPLLGALPPLEESAPPAAPAPIAETLGSAVLDLEPVLTSILRPDTHAGLRALADRGARPEAYSDELWGRIVAEFAAAHASERLPRDHLFMALVPLYLGRYDAFVAAHRLEPPQAVREQIDALGDVFERLRPHWIECWNA